MIKKLKQQLLIKLGAWNSIEILHCRDMAEYYEIIVNKVHYRVLVEDVQPDTIEPIVEEIHRRYRAKKYTGLIKIKED